MTRLHSFMKAALVFAIPAVLAVASPRAAEAQVVVAADVVVEPPAAFVATAAPEYFEGRPCYWYNNHWYYRHGGGWGFYRGEPAFLAGRRAMWARPGYYRGRGYVGGGVYVHPAPGRYVYRR
jgi:hypothetical protein